MSTGITLCGLSFVVSDGIAGAPLSDFLMHGYESRQDFRDALRALVGLWKGRTGECVAERNGFLLLRFHDTPGGRPDEAWIPLYLLRQIDGVCRAGDDGERDETEAEIDAAFGF